MEAFRGPSVVAFVPARQVVDRRWSDLSAQNSVLITQYMFYTHTNTLTEDSGELMRPKWDKSTWRSVPIILK